MQSRDNLCKLGYTIQMTKLLKECEIDFAATIIKRGGTVAFRTETVYGLGADATNDEAVQKIFVAKGRPQSNPLIIHFASLGHLLEYFPGLDAKTRHLFKRLVHAFAIVLPKPEKSRISSVALAGLDTVAVRIPSCKYARKFIRACGVPLAAPSANTSSRPSPTRWQDAYDDLNKRIDAILMGKQTNYGVESTVAMFTQTKKPGLMILRQGGIDAKKLAKRTGFDVEVASGADLKRSPGTVHKHYAPSVPVYVIAPKAGETKEQFNTRLSDFTSGKAVAVMCLTHHKRRYKGYKVIPLGFNASMVKRNLFAGLREAEKYLVKSYEGEKAIIAVALPEKVEYACPIERLEKSSEGRKI